MIVSSNAQNDTKRGKVMLVCVADDLAFAIVRVVRVTDDD